MSEKAVGVICHAVAGLLGVAIALAFIHLCPGCRQPAAATDITAAGADSGILRLYDEAPAPGVGARAVTGVTNAGTVGDTLHQDLILAPARGDIIITHRPPQQGLYFTPPEDSEFFRLLFVNACGGSTPERVRLLESVAASLREAGGVGTLCVEVGRKMECSKVTVIP